MACRWQITVYLLLLPSASVSLMSSSKPIIRIAEKTWREAASQHVQTIRELLLPGLSAPSHVINSGRQRTGSRVSDTWLTALDPKHPTYNFLIEYYGLKGRKGTRRLTRWSPKPELLLRNDGDRITELDQLTKPMPNDSETHYDGILLEGASEDDLGGTLHLRGAIPHPDGIMYSPTFYFDQVHDKDRAATPFMWYRSVLQQTLKAEPVLHCHGLHEWAMQYWPEGASAPPSGKYQSHLPLRVSRGTLNEAVERRGISCTHVDALRYFAPSAGPLNHHGHILHREDQLRLEQPACVHAQMDLLKITLKLVPFHDPMLLQKVLEIALESRKLDVAASPYDASDYGIDVIPVETQDGRATYRQQQVALMRRAEPIREELLQAYNLILNIGFGNNEVTDTPSSERFAKAEPGGLPWKKNPITNRAEPVEQQ